MWTSELISKAHTKKTQVPKNILREQKEITNFLVPRFDMSSTSKDPRSLLYTHASLTKNSRQYQLLRSLFIKRPTFQSRWRCPKTANSVSIQQAFEVTFLNSLSILIVDYRSFPPIESLSEMKMSSTRRSVFLIQFIRREKYARWMRFFSLLARRYGENFIVDFHSFSIRE